MIQAENKMWSFAVDAMSCISTPEWALHCDGLVVGYKQAWVDSGKKLSATMRCADAYAMLAFGMIRGWKDITELFEAFNWRVDDMAKEREL